MIMNATYIQPNNVHYSCHIEERNQLLAAQEKLTLLGLS